MTKSANSLLSWHETEAEYRQPYILRGYRQTNTSFFQCLRYALVLHNDVINFWTHFLPFLAWIVWFPVLASYYCIDLSQPCYYPLICFWIGCCSYALFSSNAHLFASKSPLVHEICFMLDYLGIAMYGLGLNIVGLFYLSPTSSSFFSYRGVIFTLEISFAIMATVIGCLSIFFWHKYCYIIRVSVYVLPYVCYIGPFLHRLSHCWLYGIDCVPETTHLHFLSMLFTGFSAFFYISKIPERLMPGNFDFFFQSHQLFHVCCVITTSLQMYAIPLEMQLRGVILRQVEGAMPNLLTTLLPFACAEVLGLVAVVVLGLLTWKEVLISVKIKKKL